MLPSPDSGAAEVATDEASGAAEVATGEASGAAEVATDEASGAADAATDRASASPEIAGGGERGTCERPTPTLPPEGSIERWAYDYIHSQDLAYKCAPPAPPKHFAPETVALDVRAPGRPEALRVTRARPRSLSASAMREPANRAKLLHKFWHHELQAAELMCWALLRFAEAESEFRRGLIGICQDEIRHMGLYQRHIEQLGFRLGDFSVRDWFWERVPTCESPVQFVALMGMGLEAANLEHTPRFEAWFVAAGDHVGAELQAQVGREEVGHVRFGMRWFKTWTGSDDFETWQNALPKPLTPLLLRGKTINRAARLRAEMSEAFISQLEAWRPEPHGRR